MPVVTTIVTGEYVYNEGHTEVKQQIFPSAVQKVQKLNFQGDLSCGSIVL